MTEQASNSGIFDANRPIDSSFSNNSSPDRIILIYKPASISSFGVVARVRRSLRDEFGHKIKVGHTGTLDPFATGLLILLSGQNTKKSADFLNLDKTYEATLKLGFTSTTGDPEGNITKWSRTSSDLGRPEATAEEERRSPVTTGGADAVPNLNEVETVLKSFVGEISQTVPKFSAIKINGRRAYQLARAGQTFETPTRKITIYNIELLSYNYPELKIRCDVSSGTYIRTLAEDIGQQLGTGAYLTALRRLKVGPYDVKNAQKLTFYHTPPENTTP